MSQAKKLDFALRRDQYSRSTCEHRSRLCGQKDANILVINMLCDTPTVSERAKAQVNTEMYRDLELLDAVAVDQSTTQRTLSARLGLALGLTNLYLRRLVRKGFIKCVNIRPNRIRYFITPQGIAERTRLAYDFMNYSLRLYKEVRIHLRKMLEPLARDGATRIAIYGTGEAAELAYLSLKELGLDPVAIFDSAPAQPFLGIPVRTLHAGDLKDLDFLILAYLENPADLSNEPCLKELSHDKILMLRPDTLSSSIVTPNFIEPVVTAIKRS